jgi:hypothetical protein
MPPRPTLRRRAGAAARWPLGIALTSWSYMWRTTPMHRSEQEGSLEEDGPPALPDGIERDELQEPKDGVAPLFHRRYVVRIRGARLSPEQLLERVSGDPNAVAPSEFAWFHKVRGGEDRMRPGDEYLVHMPGPWNGPVRVVEVTPRSFRFATLEGHLEAGQIEFAADQEGDELRFRIESWASSGDRLSRLLYHRLRMAKEVQLHMWTSFLERVARASGGRVSGGIEIITRRAGGPGAGR